MQHMTLYELGKRLRHLAHLGHDRDKAEIEEILLELKRRDMESQKIRE